MLVVSFASLLLVRVVDVDNYFVDGTNICIIESDVLFMGLWGLEEYFF